MAVTPTATGGCKTSPFFILSPAPPPAAPNFSPPAKPIVFTNGLVKFSSNTGQRRIITTVAPRAISSAETPVAEEKEEAEEESKALSSQDDLSLDSASLPLTGCKACGKPEIENGCNGEGRIQGGIATVPGFGWWPIKAYRPCPAFVASGGRYRRSGQSMDEVVSGGGGKGGTTNEAQSSKKKEGLKKSKR